MANLSIIIPTLNMAHDLPSCLAALRAEDNVFDKVEIIICDGGSKDDWCVQAERFDAISVSGSLGRGQQLRRGAGLARGDWLLFMHADTQLQSGWAQAALLHIQTQPESAAYFRLKFKANLFQARIIAFIANMRSYGLALPYGDQGLFISRKLYDELGGFKPMPLMEDVDMVCRIGRKRLKRLNTYALTCGIKYQQQGWIKRSFRNAILLLRFLLGEDVKKLADIYYPDHKPHRKT